MIKVLKEGSYELIETKQKTKILILDNTESYAWIHSKNIGEMLVSSNKSHVANSTLASGKYRLYDISDEPTITDLIHLELLIGQGKWQGYLLPTGLPTTRDKRNRIIPTHECITKK